ncbi:hypothetical protein [Streptomyces smyrnaeus]|uniref:hypothetical protein n=1 Tax=Streptomyces smyrnaeus TaxID=1387713 RepID=UPI0033D4E9FE
MDDDQWEMFTLGIGMMVRSGALLEYTLHGLAAHLLEAHSAYGEGWAADPVTQHIEVCEKAARDSESPLPEPAREALLADLASCRRVLDRRNLFVHACWQYEEESGLWWGIKANRKEKGRAQVESARSREPLELSAEIGHLQQDVLGWDIEFFGEDGDPDEGEPSRVVVKRLI